MFKDFSVKKLDYFLIILVFAISLIGIFAIGSAQSSLQGRQIEGLAAGLFVMLAASVPDYGRLLKGCWFYYGICIFLLVMVIYFGSSGGGAQRWFTIGGLTFQPSESAKILLILFYAAYIMKHKDRMHSLLQILICTGLIAVPLALIMKQPDLSTTIVVFLIFCTLLFIGGIRYRFAAGVIAVAVPSFLVFLFMVLQEGSSLIKEFQRLRILAWLHPEDYPDTAFQTLNSIMAIGSGQVFGKGYNSNEIYSLLNSGFISQSQTDLIFTVIAEEFGFVGSCTVVVLILAITVRCLVIAKNARDLGGSLIAGGVGAWIGFQGFINIGVACGLLPNTGLPLPFVSYGLTSLLVLYLGIGLVLNVRMRSQPLMTVNTVTRIRSKIS